MRRTAISFRLVLALSLVTVLAFATAATADTLVFTATLTGAQEVPPTGSTATGNATVTLDTVANTLNVLEAFSGLTGGSAIAAHIHCCVPAGTSTGVAIPFTSFPNATSGSYSQIFDLTLTSTYISSFITANGGTAATAEAALIAGLNSGNAYVNIHDAVFPGGEIRGQLQPVSEPSTLMLLGSGVAGLAGVIRRKLK